MHTAHPETAGYCRQVLLPSQQSLSLSKRHPTSPVLDRRPLVHRDAAPQFHRMHPSPGPDTNASAETLTVVRLADLDVNSVGVFHRVLPDDRRSKGKRWTGCFVAGLVVR